MGKPELGLPHLQAALSAYQLLADSYNIALTTQDIALSYLQLGQYGNALPGFERALAAWRNHDNLSGQALVLNNMGYLFSLQGKYEQALTHLEEALTCAQRSGYTRNRLLCLAQYWRSLCRSGSLGSGLGSLRTGDADRAATQ